MLNKRLKVYLNSGGSMGSEKDFVVKQYDIQELVFVKDYKFKKIYVRVYDLCVEDRRCTRLICDKYCKDEINLVNASNDQIVVQVDNMFRNALAAIDENSISNKIKKLFK